jgi:hypothetical protein
MEAMQSDGFKDGDVVQIRKVQESNTTPVSMYYNWIPNATLTIHARAGG